MSLLAKESWSWGMSEEFNEVLGKWKLRQQVRPTCQLKIIKLKTWGDCAPHQGEMRLRVSWRRFPHGFSTFPDALYVLGRVSTKPHIGSLHIHQLLPSGNILAQHSMLHIPLIIYLKNREWIALVKMPHFRRRNPVQAGDIPGGHQEVDGGTHRPAHLEGSRQHAVREIDVAVLEGLCEEASLGMGLEAQKLANLLCRRHSTNNRGKGKMATHRLSMRVFVRRDRSIDRPGDHPSSVRFPTDLGSQVSPWE